MTSRKTLIRDARAVAKWIGEVEAYLEPEDINLIVRLLRELADELAKNDAHPPD